MDTVPILIRLLAATAAAGALSAAGQPETPEKIEWIARNSVALHSIDPGSGFADLQPLKRVIGNAKVVMLGAVPMGDGKEEQRLQAAGLNAQARLVRFLHEEMGFDLLITKASLFDAVELDRALDGKRPLSGDLRDANLRDNSKTQPFYSWRRTPPGGLTCSPAIMDYARATRKTSRPLRFSGLGVGLSKFAAKEFPDRLFRYIDSIDPKLATPDDRRIIRESLEWGAATVAGGESFQFMISRIASRLGPPPGKDHSQESAVVLAGLEDLVSWALHAPRSPLIDPGSRTLDPSSAFSERVARRLQWLADERHPGIKTILCLDNDWIVGKAQDTPGGEVRRIFNGAYSIAFTGFRDDEAIPATLRAGAKPKLVPAYASIEGLMRAAEIQYGFLDFSLLPFDHWLWEPIAARLISARPVSQIWAPYYDGVLYVEAR